MSYPETRPDGSPLATEVTDAIRHWFCRSGIDLDAAKRVGLIDDALLLKLWNIRDDRLAGLQCGQITSASFDRPAPPR